MGCGQSAGKNSALLRNRHVETCLCPARLVRLSHSALGVHVLFLTGYNRLVHGPAGAAGWTPAPAER
jgi:hypothetical protein